MILIEVKILPTTWLLIASFVTLSAAYEPEIMSRILYGTPIDITEYPYFAMLGDCGGAIISETWIVTAAHCVEDVRWNGSSKKVWVGGVTESKSQIKKVTRIVIHPKYYSGHNWNDIALLQLSEKLNFTSKIRPIRLPKTKFAGGNMVLVGKGVDQTGKSSRYVQMVNLYGYNDIRNCPVAHNGGYFCLYRVDLPMGACMGDSGSPLMQNGVLVGILTAIGNTDCRLNTEAFAINVAHYIPWIHSVTRYNPKSAPFV